MKIKSAGTSTSWTDSWPERWAAHFRFVLAPRQQWWAEGCAYCYCLSPQVLFCAEVQVSSALRTAASKRKEIYNICVCVCVWCRASTQVCVCVVPLLLIFVPSAPIHFIHSFIGVVLATVLLLLLLLLRLLRNGVCIRNYNHTRTYAHICFAFVAR